jgi:hypothetical protein
MPRPGEHDSDALLRLSRELLDAIASGDWERS